MSRSYEWAEWRGRRRALAGAAAGLAERRATSAPGSRTRDAEARDALVRGSAALARARVAQGRLVRLGPRRYELRPSA